MTQTPGSNIPTFDSEENLAGIRRWVEIETPCHDGAAVMARSGRPKARDQRPL